MALRTISYINKAHAAIILPPGFSLVHQHLRVIAEDLKQHAEPRENALTNQTAT